MSFIVAMSMNNIIFDDYDLTTLVEAWYTYSDDKAGIARALNVLKGKEILRKR